jgi:hypothetical protein
VRIVRARDGAPIHGARVTTVAEVDSVEVSCFTDEQGRAMLPAIVGNESTLQIVLRTQGSGRAESRLVHVERVSIPGEVRVDLDLL